jgi:hypothetical protein
MPSATALLWLTGLVDGLTLIFVAMAAPAMQRFGVRRAGILILPVVVWGLAWTYLPDLVTLRRETRVGIPVSIAAVLIYFQIVLRKYGLAGEAGLQVLRLSGWRVVFGGLLGIIGILGGLPPGFYISAAAGDIAVGLLGLALMARGRVSNRALLAWNIIGLVDLVHVLVVGAIYLEPFFSANPAIPIFGLLPTVGVPMFIALHVVALRGLRRGASLKATA